MYVGGQISNAETVLVDIGTGYYVEMVGLQYFEHIELFNNICTI